MILVSLLAVLGLVILEVRGVELESNRALLPRFEAYRTLLVFIGCFGIVQCSICAKWRLWKLFSVYELRWLGNISYSFYLVHTLPLNIVKLFVVNSHLARQFPHLTYLLLFPIALTASILIATVAFLIFEKRFSVSHKHTYNVTQPILLVAADRAK